MVADCIFLKIQINCKEIILIMHLKLHKSHSLGEKKDGVVTKLNAVS